MKKLAWTLPLSFVLAAVVLAQQPPGKKGSGGPPDPAAAFRFLDANRDGKLDKREFANAPFTKSQPAGMADATFTLLDKNKDGFLTSAEFQEIAALRGGPGRPGGNEPAQPQFATPKSATATKTPERAASPEELTFFESRIRPVLVEKCYKCHATGEGNKIKGGLALDTRESTRKGGDSGPAVVPGNPAKSLLLEAIRYTKNDLQMPPEKDGGKLSDAIIKDFERWIQTGAADPRTGGAVAKKEYDGSKAKDHWAYQPPKKSPVPAVKNAAWPKTDIDRFVLAKLEAEGLAPVADAGKLTLLRRVYFDLIGLPPTFDEVNAFLDDKSADPFANAVDRLLASPQFGERWGRHWLDVARYAESTGKDVNTAYPHAWRYRDYVIAAFNADKPYDRFVREQVAGDLLPSTSDKQKAEQLVATGFLAIGPRGLNEQNARLFYLDVADEQIDTLSQAFLGTTIACARCHDHKFDPISQQDYYALAGIFLSTDTRYGTTQGVQNRRPSELFDLPKNANAPTLGRNMSREERARVEKQLADKRAELRDLFMPAPGQKGKGPQPDNDPRRTLDRLRLLQETGQLESRLKQYDATTGEEKALAMGVQDLPRTQTSDGVANLRRFAEGRIGGARPNEFSAIADSALYTRGDASKPAEKVARAFPVALTHGTPPRIPNYASGRKELAEWLTATGNPLTARVWVNRVWGWLVGDGLVNSPDNFGTTGGRPSNPALLDTLAVRFMESGWSTKKLIREIVLSHAYQLSSAYNEKNHTADPENRLQWRMSPRRLDAEGTRDAMLHAAGRLDLKPPVGSVLLTFGDRPMDGPNLMAGLSDAQLSADTTHRSVYLPIVRDREPEVLDLFDFPDASLVTGKRESTSVPAQALFLLNSPFVADQAGALANRLLRWQSSGVSADEAAQLKERVNVAYWLTLTRPPSANELKAAQDFFAKFTGGKPASPALQAAAWTSYCRALFAGAEFRQLN